MSQDFAKQISQPSSRTSKVRFRRPFKRLSQLLSRLLPKRLSKKLLNITVPRYAGIAFAALMTVLVLAVLIQGQRASASIPTTHEEWLDVEKTAFGKANKPLTVDLLSGDTATSALGRLGYPFAEVIEMARASKPVYSLRNVHEGHAFSRVDDAQSMHIYYDIDAARRLHLSNGAETEGWHAEILPRSTEKRRLHASGMIEDSLFAAGTKAGIDDRTTMNLVDIFSWDIDFAREIRKGDRFTVLYEEQFDDVGKMIGSVILAAEFINQGKSYQAIRYVLANGRSEYFTPEGRSLRKTYLKSPVKYSRISSRFSHSRKHPVLGYTRAHRGVDYAASSGTPIRAIGNGRVIYAGRKGGYGRFVKIRHDNANHSTAYAHLRRYGRGIRKGRTVKQGQIIGYVGMSGLATGPHLHFEFLVRGRAINPLSVRHAPARPVPKSEIEAFKEQANIWVQRMSKPMLLAAWG